MQLSTIVVPLSLALPASESLENLSRDGDLSYQKSRTGVQEFDVKYFAVSVCVSGNGGKLPQLVGPRECSE